MTNEEIMNIAVDAYKRGSNDTITVIFEFLKNISNKQEDNFNELLTNMKDK